MQNTVGTRTHAHTQARTLTNHIGIYFRKQYLHGLPSLCGILGLGREQLQLPPKDVRKPSQCKRHAVLQRATCFRHLNSAYSIIDGPTYLGDLYDMHHKAGSGSAILAHPNFIVPMSLAKFRPHRDTLQYAIAHSCHPLLEDNAVIAEWTSNVRVDALIRIFNNHPTDPNEGKEFWRGPPQG